MPSSNILMMKCASVYLLVRGYTVFYRGISAVPWTVRCRGLCFFAIPFFALASGKSIYALSSDKSLSPSFPDLQIPFAGYGLNPPNSSDDYGRGPGDRGDGGDEGARGEEEGGAGAGGQGSDSDAESRMFTTFTAVCSVGVSRCALCFLRVKCVAVDAVVVNQHGSRGPLVVVCVFCFCRTVRLGCACLLHEPQFFYHGLSPMPSPPAFSLSATNAPHPYRSRLQVIVSGGVWLLCIRRVHRMRTEILIHMDLREQQQREMRQEQEQGRAASSVSRLEEGEVNGTG